MITDIFLVALLLFHNVESGGNFNRRRRWNKTSEDVAVGRASSPVHDHIDWREQGMVSPVKSQGKCESCWAFSVVGAVESHLAIYTSTQKRLSEQFLIDCVQDNSGCESGSLLAAYAYTVRHLGGILLEDEYYPFSARTFQCRWRRPESLSPNQSINPYVDLKSKKDTLPVPVIGFKRVQSNEDAMAEAIYNYGPISAAINSASMANYKNGIDEPTDEQCDPKKLDHSILIVGFSAYVDKDTGARLPYWIIKNSWGDTWGDSGYYYLVRGRNACGIASDVMFPFVQ